MSTSDLSGRVAVVSGGSRGIGRAIAAHLLARGARVVISGLSQNNLDAARAELGAGVETVRADVREPGDCERLVARAAEAFGGLDILVNNAAVGHLVPAAEMSVEQWRDTMRTNLDGVFYCCRAAIPRLRQRGGGWIINISSLAGKNAFQGGAAYCASKSGLNAFSEALMQELRYDDIRVAYVMPGSVNTDFGGSPARPDDDWKLAADDVAQVVMDLIAHPQRSLPSRVEIRPSRPKRK
jgi:NAD(P)-dependent dehydrogenase (short-subunit alcohol dehydrogenase family)